MENYTTYTVEAKDLELLKSMNLNQRIKWIREKANEYNPSAFSMYRISEKIGVNQSVLSRTEMDVAPRYTLVDAIANVLGVSIEVFSDNYYEQNPAPFVICEQLVKNQTNSTFDKSQRIDLFDAAYVVRINVEIESLNSEFEEKIIDEFEIAPFDYEEVIEGVMNYIQRMKKRRKRLKSKQMALEKLINSEGRGN